MGPVQKRPPVSPAQPGHAKYVPFLGQGRRGLALGAYTEYVRVNGAKSAKPVQGEDFNKGPRTTLADFFNRPIIHISF